LTAAGSVAESKSINFTTTAGPLGVKVTAGSLIIDADGSGPSTQPAIYVLTLSDNDGD